ncbi:amidohydrolase, partial [bacterium]|nr:amidohydrolase [bacterium]
ELSWKEFQTTLRLSEILHSEGLRVRPGIARTGLIADLPQKREGRTLAIRADLDGLPMYDAKDVAYASKVEDVMHACGHDAHCAMVIGVAKVLKRLAVDLPGRVRFIFQPSEEATPSGAHELVKSGCMEGVDAILAYHVDPEIEVGKIGLREGILTAHCNEFRLTILGKSGHAARPHHGVDAIYLAHRVVGALYDLVPDRSQNMIPAVLSLGKITGGTKANIIPERVEIAGTVRTIDEQSRREIFDAMEGRVRAITESAGGSFELEVLDHVPSVVNEGQITGLVRNVASERYGNDNIVDIEEVSLGGEDFSWFLTKAPGALIRLGVKTPSEEIRYLHTHNFDIDERAIPHGVALMATIATQYLLEGIPAS